MAFFNRKFFKNPNIHITLQKTPNSQSNIEKEEQSWKHHTFRFPTILQSYSIKTIWD